jgi:hypothetical protein
VPEAPAELFLNQVPQQIHFHSRYGSFEGMNQGELSKDLVSIGSRGGKARAKALSKKEQRAIALKASKAAAKARRTAKSASR